MERLCLELNLTPCLNPFERKSIDGDLLYVRLHGEKGYRDTYSEEEMKRLMEMGRDYAQVYLMFNNVSMYEDALRLKGLLKERS